VSSPLAARQVFELYAPIARRIALSFAARFSTLGLKEDFESAALAALWRAALTHAERPRVSLEGYVVVVVKGACLDELAAHDWLPRRTRRKHGGLFVRIPLEALEDLDSFGEFAVAAEAEAAVDRKQHLERLRLAISQLRKRERVILGKFLSGMNWVEIAHELEVAPPRISQIWSRIVAKLRAALGVTPARVPTPRDWRALKK
jgi:RNA polymerase sigma factor (sigma-70 family)